MIMMIPMMIPMMIMMIPMMIEGKTTMRLPIAVVEKFSDETNLFLLIKVVLL